MQHQHRQELGVVVVSTMEHTCIDCGEMVFNNSPRGHCPKCGGQMHHQWDEQADYDRERAERDREQDGE